MKVRIFPVLLVLLLLLLPATGQCRPTVGFLVPASGLGDHSLNDLTYTGIIQAKNRHNFQLFRVQCEGGAEGDRRQAMETVIKRGATVIVVNGWQYRNLVREYASRFPRRTFLLNDFPISDHDNVISTVFAQHEGAFLAGALAGWLTETGHLGFIGGMDMVVIRAFQQGFREGALHAHPGVQLSEVFLAPAEDAFSGFSSPSLGFSMAGKIYDSGADIILGAAGLSNQGILQAARRKQRLAIGADTDQDHLAEGFVLTSVMKRLDQATASILDRLFTGEPVHGVQRFGLKEGGVSLSPMTFTRERIPEEIRARVEQLRQQIIDGSIVVTDPLATGEE